MADRRVERTVVLPASPSDVWEALLDEDQLAQWFGEIHVDPRFGGTVTFVDDDGRQRRGVVETLEPGHKLGFRWWGDDEGSRVEFVVEEADDGTRLTVVETALRSPAVRGPRALAMAG